MKRTFAVPDFSSARRAMTAGNALAAALAAAGYPTVSA